MLLPVNMAKATNPAKRNISADTPKRPQKAVEQHQAAVQTKKTAKRKRAVMPDSESSSNSDGDQHSAPKRKATSTASSEHNLERDGLTIVDDGEKSGKQGGTAAEEDQDTEIVEVNSDDELGAFAHRPIYEISSRQYTEHAQQRWRSPIYGFFHPAIEISYKNGRRSHVFRCAAKGCKAEVRRYLDTGDRASSGNLFKHARACWGNEVVNHAIDLGDADVVREKVVTAKPKSGSITDFFRQTNPHKPKFSHRPLTKVQTRCVSNFQA